jgi:predicted phosphodiesterase
MKIAVLADIHANYVALQTAADHIAAWQPDAVVMAGDLVTRGPRPSECLRFVQANRTQEAWQWVRGNHEDYVISVARPDMPHSGPEFEVHRASIWAYQNIGADVSSLEAMPFMQSLTGPDGREVRIVHASMIGNRDGIYPGTTEREMAAKIDTREPDQPAELLPAVLCVGHTHIPLIRRHNHTLVVNAGSVGLPFDQDRRLSYAQLTWQSGEWQAEIIRLEYDWEQAERDFFESGYFDGAGPLVEIVLVEFRTASSQLFYWARDYQARALQGEISMQASVQDYLRSLF